MQNLKRRVLVTGSSRGIGRAIALQLAKDGFEVVAHCRDGHSDAKETARQAQELGSAGLVLQFDVSDREKSRFTLANEIETNGAFYGVVLNAGVCRDGPFPALTDSDWDEVLGVNLDGFYNVLHPLVLPMIQLRQGGRIVCLSSISGLAGNRGQVNYSAAKAGLIGATRSLAQELAKRSITVNCVAPGLIESEMTSKLPLDELMKEIPMRRLGQPEEVGGLVSYLFSDIASYVTGQTISLNGGML